MNRIEVTDAFRDALRELTEVSHSNPQIEGCLPQLSESAADLFRVKNDFLVAPGTRDLIITLEPTERLLEYVAAKRARDRRVLDIAPEG